jgi:hypothetical protein
MRLTWFEAAEVDWRELPLPLYLREAKRRRDEAAVVAAARLERRQAAARWLFAPDTLIALFWLVASVWVTVDGRL